MPIYGGHQTRWHVHRGKVHLLRLATAHLLTRTNTRFIKALCGVTIDEWARPTEQDVTCKSCLRLTYVQYSERYDVGKY